MCEPTMEPAEYRFGLGLDVQSLVKEKVKDLVGDLWREGKHGSWIGKAKAKAAFRVLTHKGVRSSQGRRTWLGGDRIRIRIVSSEVATSETVVEVVRIATQHLGKMLWPALLRNQARASAHRRTPTECPVSWQLG